MSYTKENLHKTAEILAQRRAEAQAERDLRHEKVCREIPEIAGYETELSKSGLAIAEAMGKGGDAAAYISELSGINLNIQRLIKEALVKNGYPGNYLETPYTCSKCSDTGYVGGFSCECRNDLLRKLSVGDLEKVSPAKKCTFENFSLDYYSTEPDANYGISPREKMEDILEYCKCYADDFGPDSDSLYMRGATGLGKTHLSLAIANVAARNGYNVIYGSAQNLLSSIEREKFSGSNSGEEESRIMNCDLLIIDDLGSEFSTQYTVSVIYNIVNTRLNTERPVIISTNLTDRELEDKYTQRITSRIIGSYTSLYFMGRDIRQIRNQG